MAPSTTSKVTTNHDEIRRWAEERGAKPAAVARTESSDDAGIIRLDFPGYSGEASLEEISWDEWFDKFEKRKLALLYQEQTVNGERSNFNKIVSRETADEVESAVGGRGRSASRRRRPSRQTKSTVRVQPSRSGTAKKTAAKNGRAGTTKEPVSARGRGSSSGRSSTRSRSAAKRTSRATAGGGSRGSNARNSRTTTRVGGKRSSARSSGSRSRSSASHSRRTNAGATLNKSAKRSSRSR